MQLHSEGKKDYIKELKRQRDKEIEEVRNNKESDSKKVSLVQKIRLKFTKLIEDSNEKFNVSFVCP